MHGKINSDQLKWEMFCGTFENFCNMGLNKIGTLIKGYSQQNNVSETFLIGNILETGAIGSGLIVIDPTFIVTCYVNVFSDEILELLNSN